MNLHEQLAQALAEARKALEAGELEKGKEWRQKAESLKSAIDELKALDGLRESMPPMRPTLPGAGAGTTPESGEDPLAKAVNLMRFGAVDDPTDRVMREVYDGDYRQITFDQSKAFTRYMRKGVGDRILSRQIWGVEEVKSMLRDGLTVAEIKATMVEGQDTLGGYAVPPQIANQTIARLPGLTAVRGGGALVVQTGSNMIEWLKITGGDGQYVSGMRGQWGSETQSPAESNFTVGLKQIPVHVYTYKVPMSVSLLEDASNLQEVFMQLIADTLAIDEDTAFVTGDGANKPRGLLPGSANAHAFTEVASGHATELTWTGLKACRRGVASQYRMGASWIGNSDTAGDIETMLDGTGRTYVDFVDVGQPVLRATWRESEAMPDVGAGAFALIYGNLKGYAIIERMGMSIQRYNDSNTGINKVEFHVRRRIGGDVIEPWKFALQKVAAS